MATKRPTLDVLTPSDNSYVIVLPPVEEESRPARFLRQASPPVAGAAAWTRERPIASIFSRSIASSELLVVHVFDVERLFLVCRLVRRQRAPGVNRVAAQEIADPSQLAAKSTATRSSASLSFATSPCCFSFRSRHAVTRLMDCICGCAPAGRGESPKSAS